MAEPTRVESVSRRTVLKGLAGAAGLVTVPAIIAAAARPRPRPRRARPPQRRRQRPACGPERAAPSVALGPLSIGSYHSDPGEKAGMEAVNAAFTAATGIAVNMNTVDHGTFQDQITNYLGGTPDTAYTWFSGFRMKFFADQGFNTPIDDVWATVKGNYTEGFANSVVGNDGKVYGIPVDYYPWAVFYRKSVFADKGYTDPGHLGRSHRPRQEDEGGRAHADRVRRQGRLAGDGHLRHPQPAAQRLRLPRRPDGRHREVDRPEGHGGLPEMGRDRPLPRQGLRRPDLAERRRHARPEEVRDVPARPVRVGAVRRDERSGRSRRPRLLPVPGPRHPVRRREGARRADRHVADLVEVAEPRGRGSTPPRPISSSGPRVPPSCSCSRTSPA